MACVCPGGQRDKFTPPTSCPPPFQPGLLLWAAAEAATPGQPALPSPWGPAFQTFSSSVYQPGLIPSPDPLAKFCLAPCPCLLLSLEQEPVGARLQMQPRARPGDPSRPRQQSSSSHPFRLVCVCPHAPFWQGGLGSTSETEPQGLVGHICPPRALQTGLRIFPPQPACSQGGTAGSCTLRVRGLP